MYNMDKLFRKTPFYALFVIIVFALEGIGQWFFGQLINEVEVIKVLNNSIEVKIKYIIVIIVIIVALITGYVNYYRDKEYRDFSKDEIKLIRDSLSAQLEDSEYTEGFQIFSYKWGTFDHKLYVKFNFLDGVTKENIETNAVLQTYFRFQMQLGKKIKNCSEYYRMYLSETNSFLKQEKHNIFMEEGRKICDHILRQLNAINSQAEITDMHSDMYQVLIKILSKISDQAIETCLQNKEIEHAIMNRKKTGILSAAILNDIYIYRNCSSVSKNGRIYYVFPLTSTKQKKGIIILGIIDGDLFSSEETLALEDYCKKTAEKICANQ